MEKLEPRPAHQPHIASCGTTIGLPLAAVFLPILFAQLLGVPRGGPGPDAGFAGMAVVFCIFVY